MTIAPPADGYHGVSGQSRSFVFAASEPGGPGGPFTYQINWGDTTPVQTVAGSSSMLVAHTFASAGSYAITATATDRDGAMGPTSDGLPVSILVVEQQGKNVLIGGRKTTDLFTLTRGADAGALSVSVNGSPPVDVVVGRPGYAQILGQGGGDVVSVSGTAGADTFLVSAVSLSVNGTVIKGSNVAGWLLQGRAGTNTLLGPVQNNAWWITGVGTGKLNNSFSFSGMTHLIGGALSDHFRFVGAFASVVGGISGSSGTNTLDYSGYKRSVTVNLATRKATGAGSVANFSIVLGSSGNDTLTAAAAGSVLLGGLGTDTLVGGAGRDLLVGGSGMDTLRGGDEDDLLFGGTTTYYDEPTKNLNVAALKAIFQSWNRSGVAYETRISDLLAGGAGALVGSGRFTDDSGKVDSLFGELGTDWFLTTSGDSVEDQEAGTEQVLEL